MTGARKSVRGRSIVPSPPSLQEKPVIHGDEQGLFYWLQFYWQKLVLPASEWPLVALTQDRQEFTRWTGKRLDVMALGCYCYLSQTVRRAQMPEDLSRPATHRHLIFIASGMRALSLEVTVAHELIHLADRVKGQPRRHRHHGYDAIALEEAAITGYSQETLRVLLQEESMRLESLRRARRPIRYIYACPGCEKQYPRARRYSYAVSCSSCDKKYNPRFQLYLLPTASDSVSL
ncbi:MAG TPA: hypothetical protein VL461_03405 [Dictyobacter sp.]|jgi:hypothetical protein|nr:hypothetical protein [Dictyobacter sp.]